jgi:apolipoprotein N-acyltransferase
MNLPYTDFAPARRIRRPCRWPASWSRPPSATRTLFGALQRVFYPQADAAGQRQQRCLVRRHHRPPPAPADRAHALLETGRWMLRATNNGVTAVIDPAGRVVAALAAVRAEVLGDGVGRCGRDAVHDASATRPSLALALLLGGRLAALRRNRAGR